MRASELPVEAESMGLMRISDTPPRSWSALRKGGLVMSTLDREWAIEQIDTFMHNTKLVGYDSPNIIGTRLRGSDAAVSEGAYIVERILSRVLPGWQTGRPETDRNYKWLRDQAVRAKTEIERAAELAEHLGDNAPDMSAGNLHPWAWENGSSYWGSGHYHQAVMQAAIRVNVETQSKLGRQDISETQLFNQAFSLDPPKEGAPRLRLMGNDGSKTYENLHHGARSLAQGLYTAIRNPGMHTLQKSDGGDMQIALEQLAAFSILARWIDQAEVKAI